MTAQARTGGRSGGQGWRAAVWGGAAALMLAPAVATRVSDEMAWDSADFILFGLMLLAACGAWELAMLKTRSRAYSAAAIVAAGTALLLFMVNGAVGFIGGEDDPVNLLFFGVLTLAAGGAVIVRFRAEGMARTMAVTAAAQVAAAALAVAMVPDLKGFLLGTATFVPLWLLSAWLFGRAAREEGA
ncbi:MAG TPA: hypothetical protein VFQ67_10915 [Allosphingosinicella sp.]|jgi:hypothetical protein|nr:hypothetical protein [Allosphingosinicella sp.]